MNINKLHIILFLVTISLLAVSCKKNVRPFVGEYTYQTDGKMVISLAMQEVEIPRKGLGQMQIIKDKEDRGKVQIIKKSLTGDISTMSATIEKNEIYIEEYKIEKELTLPLVDSIKGKAKITVSTVGRLMDNTIIFEETYSGMFYQSGGSLPVIGTIKSENLQTIAKLND